MNEPHVHVPPEDVVPKSGLSADVVRLLDTDQPITVHFPGDVLCDLDGIPAGVEPSHTVTGTATVRISRAELDASGLTESEITHVRITD